MSLLDYRSTLGVASFLQLLLAGSVVIQLWVLAVALPYRRMLQGLISGTFAGGPAEIARIEDAFWAATGFALMTALVTGLIWIVWNYRTYKNLDALGRPRRYRAWWAIWGWFIPIMSLFRPRQVVGDMWLQSAPAVPDPSATSGVVVPWFFNAWWAAWLLVVLTGVAVQLGSGSELEVMASVVQWTILGVVAEVVAAPLAILVVRSISSQQDLLGRRLAGRLP